MPRQPRLLLSKSIYHVITRGNNKNIVFKRLIDYSIYLKILDTYKKELPFDLYHYCLMPNHVHLLVKINNKDNFSKFMKKINLSYFHYYRKKYEWSGHFWQDRYKSQTVGKDSYFIQCGKYIELNPVRAGIVSSPQNYAYSSFKFYALGEYNPRLTPDFMYENLGKNNRERQKNYADLVVSEVVTDTYSRQTWGSDEERYNEMRKYFYHKKNSSN